MLRFALLLAGCASAAQQVRPVPEVSVIVGELARAGQAPHLAPLDARAAAFIERAAEVHAAELPAVDVQAPGARPLAAALAAEVARFDEAALRGLSADEVGEISRRVWDNAGTAEDAAPPMRYPKLHGALRDYLARKGYARTLDAMEFARRRHTGKRKDGLTPEFQHQVEIALYLTTLKDVRDEELVLTAAMLHDVVEDYDVSREEIAARFGADVERVVWLLTKVYRAEKKDPKSYFQAISEDAAASLVKGADRVNNLQSMVGVFSPAKQDDYAAEAQRWFLPMLKIARRRFPDQASAYFNVEHMIKSQLQLVRASLAAAAAPQGPR